MGGVFGFMMKNEAVAFQMVLNGRSISFIIPSIMTTSPTPLAEMTQSPSCFIEGGDSHTSVLTSSEQCNDLN